MAERSNKGNLSRPTSSRANSASVKDTNVKASRERDLRSKEEAYKRLNDELEAKTADLLKDAEQVLRNQDDSISQASMLDRVNMEDYFKDLESGDNVSISREINSSGNQESAPPSARSKISNSSRPNSRIKKPPQGVVRKKKSATGAADDVAVPDFSLQATITNIEGRLDKGEIDSDEDDILPSVANEIGPEAQMRFMRAKLRVMQEELDKLAEDYKQKDEENNKLSTKMKETEDERDRLSRTNAGLQQQMDKFRKLADDAKTKTESLENQLSSTKKELDQLRRAQKKQESSQSATEVRLNRALEEIEKYKSQLQDAKSTGKDAKDSEKKRADQLAAENKRLEKQKSELLSGFRKQLKLIDILKRQRMHIEAARLLQFSEDEFVKALEWGDNK